MEAAASMVQAEAANPSNVDIDALPYIDQQMEHIDQMKQYVDHLISEEMKACIPLADAIVVVTQSCLIA